MACFCSDQTMFKLAMRSMWPSFVCKLNFVIKLTMYVDDKFGPLLCLNVLNLNNYFGCRNCRIFIYWNCRNCWIFIYWLSQLSNLYSLEFIMWTQPSCHSGIEEKWSFIQHVQQWHQRKEWTFWCILQMRAKESFPLAGC